MVRRVVFPLLAALCLAALNGCSINMFGGQRAEAWRGEVEQACMAQRPFRREPAVVQIRSINDQGACSVEEPLQVSALEDGSVSIYPAATLGCPVTVAVEQWLAEAVQPAALARLGSTVVRVTQMSSYACRTQNSVRGADLSEHAFGNALDVGGFVLADGRTITVKDDWSRGTPEEQAFLREAHATACRYLTTVLGPGVENHSDHFHLDLAHHNASGTSRYCRPENTMPPPAQPLSPFYNLPMAQAPATAPPSPLAYTAPAAGPATGAITSLDDLIARVRQ